MKKIQLSLALLIAVFFISCGSEESKEEGKKEEAKEISQETMQLYHELETDWFSLDNDMIKVQHLDHFYSPDSVIFKVDSLTSEIKKLDKKTQDLVAKYIDSLKSEIALSDEIDEINDEKRDDLDIDQDEFTILYTKVEEKEISEDDLKKEVEKMRKKYDDYRSHIDLMHSRFAPILRQQNALDSITGIKFTYKSSSN